MWLQTAPSDKLFSTVLLLIFILLTFTPSPRGRAEVTATAPAPWVPYVPPARQIYHFFGVSPDRRWARTEMLKIICKIAAPNRAWTLNMQLWALTFRFKYIIHLTELENLKTLSNRLRYTVVDQKGQRFWMTKADLRLKPPRVATLHFSPPKSSILLHWCRLSPSFSSSPSLPIDLQASI